MSRNTSAAATSYATVSQALISLGLFYYENFHDNPSPEAESLIAAIDSSLLNAGLPLTQANVGHIADQSGVSDATIDSAASQSNESAHKDSKGSLAPVVQGASGQCPYCDAPLLGDAKVCATCGSSLL